MTQDEKFYSLYKKQREKIDNSLKKLLANRKPASLYAPSAYLLGLPGKRLRPFLVLISAKAAGGSFAQVYNAALAVEMLHTFTLAHDDIMDKAEKRRGFLTLHKKYGLNTAILAGDSLLSVAYEYLLKDTNNANAKDVISLFTRSLVEVCEGQSLDTEFESRGDVQLSEYITMITQKTAVMVETCCAMGAMLAGAKPAYIKSMRDFGKNLGIAFQIQDDLLDIIGDESEFGKKIGGDLVEGKKTYLFLKALEKSNSRTRPVLQKMIEQQGIPRKEIPVYYALYTRLGVIEDAREAIQKYTDKALKSLHVINDETDKAIFIWLANLLIRRTY